MKLVQVELSNLGHPERMVCWVPTTFQKKKIKEGMVIVLSNAPLGIWKIEKMFDTIINHYDINYKWNAGGL